MFLRHKIRRKDGKEHWSVVENRRVEGGRGRESGRSRSTCVQNGHRKVPRRRPLAVAAHPTA